MRKLHIALAILTLSSAAASAFAEAPYPPEKPFVSTLTRAQVQQELIQAEHQGLLSQGERYPVIVQAPSQQPCCDEMKMKTKMVQGNYNAALYNGA